MVAINQGWGANTKENMGFKTRIYRNHVLIFIDFSPEMLVMGVCLPESQLTLAECNSNITRQFVRNQKQTGISPVDLTSNMAY